MIGLFLIAVGILVWEKRHRLMHSPKIGSTVIGAAILGYVLWQTLHQPTEIFMRLQPCIAAFGLALLASGCKHLKQYWQELGILLVLGIPAILQLLAIDISPITANFAGFLLWYCGFPISIQGISIHLPTGSVQVFSSCSGINTMTYALGISIISLAMFPLSGAKPWFVPFIAVLIGFFENSIRVAVMVLLVTSGDTQAFEYWHKGTGALLFGSVAIFIFCLIYALLIRYEERNKLREGTRETQRQL